MITKTPSAYSISLSLSLSLSLSPGDVFLEGDNFRIPSHFAGGVCDFNISDSGDIGSSLITSTLTFSF